ncbi:diacylglycerol kinase [Vibrio coralliilyticus]|uniref:diacylglycerol kinase n=1 Tax=Vibrio coralliilyticus TaxID=190893 RepID=UPI00148CC20C|nr:diacylglycerol kinase [Vibrio coralliilyticus]NOI51162.1 diacylglycerol kinase [Vibrio coralliilyticus]
MPQKSLHGFKRIRNATRYSYQGLKAAFKNEPAFREEIFLAAFMIPTALLLDVSQLERILLIATVVLVLIAELFNSAIEAVVDRIGEEQHELAGRAKDIGSAAVMITMLLTGYVWLEVLFL